MGPPEHAIEPLLVSPRLACQIAATFCAGGEEEVLATPAMQETTRRLLGEPRPGEGGSCKRQTTLYDCVRGAPAGERGE